MNKSNQTEALYAEYYNNNPVELTTAYAQNGDIELALKAFEKQDYKRAKTLFLNISNNDKAKLYESISLMELDMHEDAQTNFYKLLTSKNISIKENSEWYLALSLLHENKTQRVINILNPMSQDTAHLFKRQSKSLLTRLMER